MVKEKTEVVATNTAVSLPSAFTELAGLGAENITRDDIKMPYLKIIEGGTDYVKQGTDDYIDEAKIGDIINTATKELYTNKLGGVKIIPIISRKLYTEWVDRNAADSPGRPIGYHETPEGASEVEVTTDQGTKKKVLRLPNGNDLIETQYFFVLILDKDNNPTPGIISMQSTRLASARDMLTCIFNYTQKGLPAFAAILQLKTVLKQKNNNSWNIYSMTRLKEDDLLKDGFLDIENNPKANALFKCAHEQYLLATKDKNFFINVASTDTETQEVKQGSGTQSAAAKKIL